MEVCTKFLKCTIKKCRQTDSDIHFSLLPSGVHFSLLQVRSTSVGAGLPSPAMMLFNRPIRALFATYW